MYQASISRDSNVRHIPPVQVVPERQKCKNQEIQTHFQYSPTLDEAYTPPHPRLSKSPSATKLELLGLEAPVRKLAKAAMLIHEEDEARNFYEVRSGTIKAYKLLNNGRRAIIGFYSQGDVIGLPFEKKYSFSAQAVTQATLTCYSYLKVDGLFNTSSSISRKILDVLQSKLSQAFDQMVILGRKHPSERVASFLLQRNRWPIGASGQKVVIDLPMSRTDIADYLGLTQETVCRILTKFKNRGILEVKVRNQLQINDLMQLQMAAEEED